MHKIKKVFLKICLSLITPRLFRISMPICTKFQYKVLSLLGVRFSGRPRYISGKVWFDGGAYDKIHLGKSVTISSNVRILVHDYALDTIYEGIKGVASEEVIGKLLDVYIGDYSFVGTGSIIMPGANIGRCCIVGAGTVVRGTIPDYSIVIGNPSFVLEKSSKEYLMKHLQNN